MRDGFRTRWGVKGHRRVAERRKGGGRLIIRSGGCPLSAAVVERPEVCELAEALVAEIVGLPVRERCDRGESPKCRFELRGSG